MALLSAFFLSGCHTTPPPQTALEAIKGRDACKEDIRRLCENKSSEQCELTMIPLDTWNSCADKWEAYAYAFPNDREAPYTALEYLMEAYSRTPGLALSIVTRAGKIVKRFQRLFGTNALKKSRR